MASNSRILTTDGKSTAGEKHFGLTVKDRVNATTPNMTQLTIIPATDTVQNHRFIHGERVVSPDSGVTPAIDFSTNGTLSVTLDLTLLTGRFYQFNAQLTVILQTLELTVPTYYVGHYVLTSAARGNVMIGGGGGYRLDNICTENLIDNYLNEFSITLDIVNNKFVITLTPSADISLSVDMMIDATINSGAYTV